MLISLHKVCCYMYVPVRVLCLLVKVCTVWMFVISLYLLMECVLCGLVSSLYLLNRSVCCVFVCSLRSLKGVYMYAVCICQYRVHICVQGLYSRTLVAMLVSLQYSLCLRSRFVLKNSCCYAHLSTCMYLYVSCVCW